ncbi:MAG: isoprenoid biosynthesis glyoxalase ElbB [Candidatus Eremiobacterota bacterium]
MKIGVLLHGCGVFDGTEIHEAVLTLLSLNRAGAEVICIAPNKDQMHVVNHITGEVITGAKRNILEESARIARGYVKDITTVSVDDIEGLIIPGGFGVAKNLCDFAVKGENCTVDPSVEAFIKEVHSKRKPIGAICIAPALVAKILGKDIALRLTVGSDRATSEKINKMGAIHIECPVNDFVVDEKYRIVSTPAYMLGPGIKDIADGIDGLVKAVVELATK